MAIISPRCTSCSKVSTGLSVSTATRLANRLEVKAAESRVPHGSHRKRSASPWRFCSRRCFHFGETPSLTLSRGVTAIFRACKKQHAIALPHFLTFIPPGKGTQALQLSGSVPTQPLWPLRGWRGCRATPSLQKGMSALGIGWLFQDGDAGRWICGWTWERRGPWSWACFRLTGQFGSRWCQIGHYPSKKTEEEWYARQKGLFFQIVYPWVQFIEVFGLSKVDRELVLLA